MFKILHIIVDLDPGGAEVMLQRLLTRTDRARFDSRVLSLTTAGVVAERIRALGVAVESLGMRRGSANPLGLWRLIRFLRKERPHLIQTWMYHADLLGGLAARLAGNIPVVWGIHHTNLDPGQNKPGTLRIARFNAFLSKYLPRRIVCCSHSTREVHARAGYADDKMVVIPNGFDLSELRPDLAARQDVRRELEVGERAPLVGMVARFHPQKDHANFLEAAKILHGRLPDVRFLLCGDGVTCENRALSDPIRQAGLADHAHLLGVREDVPRLLAALDVAVLSSVGEAFPLVLGEAMACGVPCVSTDVGDAARIIGETGEVVPPRDPAALAAALERVLNLEAGQRRELGMAARRRIEENYSIENTAGEYEEIYREILKIPRGRGPDSASSDGATNSSPSIPA
jgi:glycosyltransferase involved in cell wall biosynthesis